MIDYLRQYAVIEGMPQVVQSFVNEHNYQTALKLQRNILLNYRNDIAKYAPLSEKTKARECFLSIPRQLAKENRKSQYGIVEEKGTASMDNLLKKDVFPFGIKLCNGNIGFAGKKITLPLYCAMFLEE